MKNTTVLLNRLKELEKEINDILDKVIDEFFIDYKDSSLPLLIYIKGYTPYFNDGDPCEHSASGWVGLNEIIWDDIFDSSCYMFQHFFDKDIEEMSFDWDYDTRTVKCDDIDFDKFAEKPEGIDELINFLIIPSLDKRYKTNYEVLITCHNGKVTVVHEDYEPSY